LAGCLTGALGVVQFAAPNVNQLFFFGCSCLLLAYLTVTSASLPRVVGVLMALAVAGWLLLAHPSALRRLS
jgi:hypothetical protein